jgi:hypothetical protein
MANRVRCCRFARRQACSSTPRPVTPG